MIKNYQPYEGIGEDLPEPIIQNIAPSQLVPEMEQQIIIYGLYLVPETWVKIQDCEIQWTELIAPNELKVSLIPENKSGAKELQINRHKGEEYYSVTNLLSLPNFEAISQVDNRGWLELNNSVDLSIGTNAGNDIRHYRNINVSRNSTGMHWNKGGWVSFPILQWDATQDVKSVDFVVYLKGNKNFIFGIIDENYNTSRYQSNLSRCAFAISKYYFVGAYGNGLYNKLDYKQVTKNKYYRFRINNNGARGQKVQLFQLAGKDKQYWDGGILYWQEEVPQNFVENGNILTPVMFDHVTSDNPLLAVRTL